MRTLLQQSLPRTAVVATAADLALLPVTAGAAFVNSFRDLFNYRADSIQAADGVTVVNALGGAGRWERVGLAHPAWSLQTAWFIDPASGNDEADGSTSGTAIKTTLELHRRITANPVVRVPTTITVLASLPATECWVADFTVDNQGGSLWLKGTRTTAFSGTLSAKVDLSTASGNGVTAKATSTWTVANEIGRLIKDVTNTRFSFVAADLGAAQAKLAPWLTINESQGSASPTEGNTTVGAAVETYTLPTVSRGQVTFHGAAVAGAAAGTIVVSDLDFANVATYASHITAINAPVCWQNCKFGNSWKFAGGTHNLINCYQASSSAFLDYCPFIRICGGVQTTSWGNNGNPAGATIDLANNVLFQGAQLLVNRMGFVRLRAVFFEDLGATACIQLLDGASIKGTSGGTVCGNNNTGSALIAGAGCRCAFTGTAANFWKLACSATPVTLSGTTTAPAMDPTTFAYNATARTITFANVDATYAGGGFGGAVCDPRSGCFFGNTAI